METIERPAIDLLSDAFRRDPFAAYDSLRVSSPVVRIPPPFNGWMLFDYDNVKWAISDHDTFSSQVQAPKWFIFFDPPSHTKLRGLVARAFTSRLVANLEPRIRELSRELLATAVQDGQMDLAKDYAVPLPMRVIAGMIGMDDSEMPLYQRWSDAILGLSYTRSGGEEATRSLQHFYMVTGEMDAYLTEAIEQRRVAARDDLLSGLVQAEVDGERLSRQEILGVFQMLVVGGQETTSNLINNAMLCLMENPDQLALLRARPELLPSAIEEVLRYRSPLQWIMRTPRRDVEVHGTTIPGKSLVLPMLGSANRDPRQFADAGRFEITRDPNPHVAFGHGIHFCLGAMLSRLEAKIALGDLLSRFVHFELVNGEPWKPRKALHVHGPASLPIRVAGAVGS